MFKTNQFPIFVQSFTNYWGLAKSSGRSTFIALLLVLPLPRICTFQKAVLSRSLSIRSRLLIEWISWLGEPDEKKKQKHLLSSKHFIWLTWLSICILGANDFTYSIHSIRRFQYHQPILTWQGKGFFAAASNHAPALKYRSGPLMDQTRQSVFEWKGYI